MKFSDDLVSRAKEEFKKKGKEMDDDEAQEALRSLAGLFEILWEMSVKETKRKNQLKKEPDGFVLEGGYSCGVCRTSTYHGEHTIWYTKWGNLCGNCHSAVKNEIIPAFVALDHESFFRDWQLKSYFEIHPQTMRKYVREGKLKARIIPTAEGKPHEYIFLRKENPGLVHRHSAARKSYDRNRAKVAARWSRETKEELRAEKKKYTQKARQRP